MKFTIEFSHDKPGILATEIARFFLDIQRIALSLTRVQHAKDFSDKELVYSSYLYNYDYLITSPSDITEESLCIVGRISKSSPGTIEIFIRVAKEFREDIRKAFRKIFDGLINDEFVQSAREAEVAEKWEDVRSKRIKNLGDAIDITNKIPDSNLRQAYLEKLLVNLESLQQNPARLKRAEISDEDPPNH